MPRYTVLNSDYPLQVHREGCADTLRKFAQRKEEPGWIIEADTVDAAVEAEAAELNSQFDKVYSVSELFRIMPCCGTK